MGLQDYTTFYTLKDKPVYMATITKSGCTFLKNLFYYLDHGELHPLGDDIHNDESEMLRGTESELDDILNSPYVFMVLRNPVNRFLSFYYEKVVNPVDTGGHWFRKEIGYDLGMNFDPDLDLEGHQKNTLILINWLEKNINGETDLEKDFHWRPQNWKYHRLKPFKPDIIPLELLDQALPLKIGDAVPNIREAMDAVRSRNVSYKPYSFDETRNWRTTKRIREVYQQDFLLHKKATRHWNSILEKQAHASS